MFFLKGKKAYSVGIVNSAAACCPCFSLVISVSPGFKAFPCSALTFFIVARVSHLPLCSVEDSGKRPYSFSATLHLCRDARVGQKVALVELPTLNMLGFFFCTPFPLWNPSMELCRTPVEVLPSRSFIL